MRIALGTGERRARRGQQDSPVIIPERTQLQDAPHHILQAVKERCFGEKRIDMLFPRPLFERGGVIAGGYDHIASWGGRLHGSSELQAIHTRHQIVGDQEWDGTLGQVA